jgi:hypothetical protein
MMKKLRNLVLIGLALALSPIPACAQMVCDINCSLQSAGAHGLKVATAGRQTADEQQSESRTTHCDEEASPASSRSVPGSGSARSMKRACRGNSCAADLELSLSGLSQSISQGVSTFARTEAQFHTLPDNLQASKPFALRDSFTISFRVPSLVDVLRI